MEAACEKCHVWNPIEGATRGVSRQCERPCDTRGPDGTISFALPTLLFGLGWFLYFVISAFGWFCSADRKVGMSDLLRDL